MKEYEIRPQELMQRYVELSAKDVENYLNKAALQLMLGDKENGK